jgi:hypothetical protein
MVARLLGRRKPVMQMRLLSQDETLFRAQPTGDKHEVCKSLKTLFPEC